MNSRFLRIVIRGCRSACPEHPFEKYFVFGTFFKMTRPQGGLANSIMVVLMLPFLIFSPRLVTGWYDTTTTVEDIFSVQNSTLSQEHNPKDGVLAMRRRSRSDEEVLHLVNTIKTHQANVSDQASRIKSMLRPPIIGRMSPSGGPSSGGTRVRFWGTNFEGGSLYKCIFGQMSVAAKYTFVDNTIECTSPRWATTKSRTKDVGVSLVIFSNSTKNVHHKASHFRKFHYYDPSEVSAQFSYRDIHSGPISGGTVVTVYGRWLQDKGGYNCRFGKSIVSGIVKHALPNFGHNDEMIICIAPQRNFAGNVNFQIELTVSSASISENAAVLPGSSGIFTYFRVPLIVAPVPNVGSIYGDSVISFNDYDGMLLRGSGEKYVCRFGGQIEVDGIYDVKAGAVKCITPPFHSNPSWAWNSTVSFDENGFLKNDTFINFDTSFVETGGSLNNRTNEFPLGLPEASRGTAELETNLVASLDNTPPRNYGLRSAHVKKTPSIWTSKCNVLGEDILDILYSISKRSRGLEARAFSCSSIVWSIESKIYTHLAHMRQAYTSRKQTLFKQCATVLDILKLSCPYLRARHRREETCELASYTCKVLKPLYKSLKEHQCYCGSNPGAQYPGTTCRMGMESSDCPGSVTIRGEGYSPVYSYEDILATEEKRQPPWLSIRWAGPGADSQSRGDFDKICIWTDKKTTLNNETLLLATIPTSRYMDRNLKLFHANYQINNKIEAFNQSYTITYSHRNDGATVSCSQTLNSCNCATAKVFLPLPMFKCREEEKRFAGAYSDEKKYHLGDSVIYKGRAWELQKTTRLGVPPSLSNWATLDCGIHRPKQRQCRYGFTKEQHQGSSIAKLKLNLISSNCETPIKKNDFICTYNSAGTFVQAFPAIEFSEKTIFLSEHIFLPSNEYKAIFVSPARRNANESSVCRRNTESMLLGNSLVLGQMWFRMNTPPKVYISYYFDYPKQSATHELPTAVLNFSFSRNALELKNNFDAVCVYKIIQQDNKTFQAQLMDHFMLGYYAGNEISLPKTAKYVPSATRRTNIVVRYEHRKDESDKTCTRISSIIAHNEDGTMIEVNRNWRIWGNLNIVLPPKPVVRKQCEMGGIPPVKSFVELSLNGQDFHGAASMYTFFDPDYSTRVLDHGRVCNPRDKRTVFSYFPTTISEIGGTVITVKGLPVDLGVPLRPNNGVNSVLISPSGGSCFNTTTVSVYGLRINPEESFGCRFGLQITKAKVVSVEYQGDTSFALKCQTPRCLSAGTVSFAVTKYTGRGILLPSQKEDPHHEMIGHVKALEDITKETLSFTFAYKPGDQIQPVSKPVRARCIFGNQKVDAHYDPGTDMVGSKMGKMDFVAPSIKCVSPSRNIVEWNPRTKALSFSVEIDGKVFDQFTFQKSSGMSYAPNVVLNGVYPKFGSKGTHLILHALTVPDHVLDKPIYIYLGDSSKKLACMFNSASKDIHCPTPTPALNQGAIDLRASFNAQDIPRLSTVKWVSVDMPHAHYVAQNRGDPKGDTKVELSVFFFRFSPSHGPLKGGTTVNVIGKGIAGGHSYGCRFGGIRVPGIFKFNSGKLANLLWRANKRKGLPRGVGGMEASKGEVGSGGGGRHGRIQCVSPPMNAAGPVPFSITINGFDYSTTFNESMAANGGLVDDFVYYDGMDTLRFSPVVIPRTGGNCIRISGQGLFTLANNGTFPEKFWCMFGGVKVLGMFVKMKFYAKCLAPQFPSSVSKIVVQVSVNDIDWHTVLGEVSNGKPVEFLQISRSKEEKTFFTPTSVSQYTEHSLSIYGLYPLLLKGSSTYMDLMVASRETTRDLRQKYIELEALNKTRAAMIMEIKQVNEDVSRSKTEYTIANNILYDAVKNVQQNRGSTLHVRLQHNNDEAKRKLDQFKKQLRVLKRQLLDVSRTLLQTKKQVHQKRMLGAYPKLKMINLRNAFTVHQHITSEGSRIFCDFKRAKKLEFSTPAKFNADKSILNCDSMKFLFYGNFNLQIRTTKGSKVAFYGQFLRSLLHVFPLLQPLKLISDPYHTATEEGRQPVWIKSTGLSARDIYNVSFYLLKHGETRRTFVLGMYDSSKEAVKTFTPPSPAGFSTLELSIDGHPFRRVPGVLPVNYGTRVHLNFRPDSSEVQIYYAPPPANPLTHNSEIGEDELVSTMGGTIQVVNVRAIIHACGPDRPEWSDNTGHFTSLLNTRSYGRFTWKISHQLSNEQKSICIQTFEVTFHDMSNQSSMNMWTTEDNNDGSGWEWSFLNDPRDNYPAGKWLEVAPSILRGDSFVNNMKKIELKFVSNINPKTTYTAEGKYDAIGSVIAFRTPQVLNEGVYIVFVSFNGIQFSGEQVKFTYDARYELDAPLEISLRLATEGLAKANETYPFNIVGRELFDSRLVFDLSESVGIARDRLIVTVAHSDTGVTRIECLKSRWVGDPTCYDIRRSFKAQASTYGSVIYNGIITWALDPLFPHGRIKYIHNVPHITGECSDRRILTKDECLKCGACEGEGCDIYTESQLCSTSKGLDGQQCVWRTCNTFKNEDTLHPLLFGKCSNPNFKTKWDCLQVGKCSNPKYKSRETCLRAEGKFKCVLPEGFQHLANNIFTIEQCVNPNSRPFSPDKASGKCEPPSGIDVGKVDFSKFTNRVLCEVPSSRANVKWKKPKKPRFRNKKSFGGICVGNEKKYKCDFSQFKNEEECLDPSARRITVHKDSPNLVQCLQAVGVDYKFAPQGRAFDCSRFTSKGTCENPELRSFLFFLETFGHNKTPKLTVKPAPFFLNMELTPHSFLSLETSSEDLPSKSAYINASAQQYEQHRRWLCANVAQVILWRKENKPWDISKMAKWDEHCGKRSIDDFANPVSFQAWQANMSKVFGSVKKDYRSVHNSTNNAAELKTDGSGSGSPKLSYKPTKKERKNKNYYDVNEFGMPDLSTPQGERGKFYGNGPPCFWSEGGSIRGASHRWKMYTLRDPVHPCPPGKWLSNLEDHDAGSATTNEASSVTPNEASSVTPSEGSSVTPNGASSATPNGASSATPNGASSATPNEESSGMPNGAGSAAPNEGSSGMPNKDGDVIPVKSGRTNPDKTKNPKSAHPSEGGDEPGEAVEGNDDPTKAPAGMFKPNNGLGGNPNPGPPGKVDSPNEWKPTNDWLPGPINETPCPCEWGQNRHHLMKCNWKTCGPSCASPKSLVVDFFRLKENTNMLTDYQALVEVGGKPLWMVMETMTATTWVISSDCTETGCDKVPLFDGMFIPFSPSVQVPIELEKKQANTMEPTLKGFLGHSVVNLAGTNVIGCPIAMAITNSGAANIGGDDRWNHTGAVGLGFWEDNLPDYLVIKDPALEIMRFMICGNIFYPVPGDYVPIEKSVELWGDPVYFPTGQTFRFSFYFGDKGGCFFMDVGGDVSGEENYLSMGSLQWVMVMPIAVKFVQPSWLFVISDVKVGGLSVNPCDFGACKASVHTGQFSITGPMVPVLKILEEAAAPEDCVRLDRLPDISFVIAGTEFTLTRSEYVIMTNAFGIKKCATAIIPDGKSEFQKIDGSFWILGDVFIRAYYTVFEIIPLRRIGFAKADHRYYEKNGCVCGAGAGPVDSVKPLEQGEREMKQDDARDRLDRASAIMVQDILDKREKNFKQDVVAEKQAAEAAHKGVGHPGGLLAPENVFKELSTEINNNVARVKNNINCPSKMALESGVCIDHKHLTEIKAMLDQQLGLDDLSSSFLETKEKYRRARRTAWPRKRGHAKPAFPSYRHLGPYQKYVKDRRERCPVEENMDRLQKSGVRSPHLENLFFAKPSVLLEEQTEVNVKEGIRVHTGEMIVMSTKIDSSIEHVRELRRNTTLLFDTWRAEMNVTKRNMRAYWRGQEEHLLDRAREFALEDWISKLERARATFRSHKVKSMINRRILKKFVHEMVSRKNLADIIEKQAEGRIDGTYINERDHWGGLYANTAVGYDPEYKDMLNKTKQKMKMKKDALVDAIQDKLAKQNASLALREWARKSFERTPSLWANNGSLWKNISAAHTNISRHNRSNIVNDSRFKSKRSHLINRKGFFRSSSSNVLVPEVADEEMNRGGGLFRTSSGLLTPEAVDEGAAFVQEAEHARNPYSLIYDELLKDVDSHSKKLEMQLNQAYISYARMKKIHRQRQRLRGGP